ncbi:lysophospholipid acyltransferase family protein [Terrarubrum flagellatum]|uniref:lysophospholipid acyltransferase family protein n=1 Tax=Terrirubrum flagellatum TaxID=2895980 RepID=UPI0031453078
MSLLEHHLSPATGWSARGLPTLREIVATPLPQAFPDRWLAKTMAAVARRSVRAIHGLEHVSTPRDPFILALNHNTRIEALFVPALLMLHRRGRLIHFLADWNFRLIPGVNQLYLRGGAITVTRKPARPAFLNVLKPLFTSATSPMEQARAHILAGRPIGVFPEGAVNRNPTRLMRGRFGAARLSLETGAPIAPAGIRLIDPYGGLALSGRALIEVHIGPLLHPPAASASVASAAEVRAWHAVMMTDIARLSGKSWIAPRETHHDP